ncbi:MAG: molecular chaperone DnaJ [Candidatus Eremiobacteraeota bacterium]|nr:molecular chaperone DnaJ [Candidatus Eremiobacteraeota bacterium]
MPADFYELLGVKRTATEVEIKRAYRGLARKYHPDVATDKVAAEAHFKQINEAYSVLSDPQKRQLYDTYGHAAVNGQPPPTNPFAGFGSEGFGDIFDMFFGGGGRTQTQQRQGPLRGQDLRYDLQVTLEEAFEGTQREITYKHLTACAACKGSGAAPGTLIVACDRCGGTGAQRTVRQTPLGQFVTQSTCTKCGGSGQTIPTPCETCGGRGRTETEKTLTVKIPAGVDDGSRIRISGNGEAGVRGGGPGDLYVFLSIARHSRFRRDGADLYLDVPISFPQAALGAVIGVEALEGPLELQIAPGTQTGSLYRMRGHGMPTVRGAGRGDLLVTVHVIVPSKLSKRERELLEEYASIGGDRIEERSFFERVKDAFKAE